MTCASPASDPPVGDSSVGPPRFPHELTRAVVQRHRSLTPSRRFATLSAHVRRVSFWLEKGGGAYLVAGRMVKSLRFSFVVLCFSAGLCGCARVQHHGDVLFQTSTEVIQNQSTFELRNVRGTAVGFRLPEYMDAINAPGYHLHFITEDRTTGGHPLDCSAQNIRIDVDYTRALFIVLPKHPDFYRAVLGEKQQKEVEPAEK